MMLRFVGLSALLCAPASGFHVRGGAGRLARTARRPGTQLDSVAIFYGTEGGATGDAAGLINEAIAETGENVFLIDDLEDPSELLKFDALIVGCPTWNTGADTERSGTPWDDLYYEDDGLPTISLEGKRVAVFGCGDSVGYGDNFCDAAGELHDVMKARGATMFGTSVHAGEGSDYEHGDSKTLRGDNFCALVLDQVNQADLSPGRVAKWAAQLRAEGFLGEAAAAEAPPAAAAAEPPAPVAAPAPAPAEEPQAVAADGSTLASASEDEMLAELQRRLERDPALLAQLTQLPDVASALAKAAEPRGPEGHTAWPAEAAEKEGAKLRMGIAKKLGWGTRVAFKEEIGNPGGSYGSKIPPLLGGGAGGILSGGMAGEEPGDRTKAILVAVPKV